MPNNVRILIAEDSPTQAELINSLLTDAGYAITVTVNGAEALASIRQSVPTLLVSDIEMPEMNGYELCRAIKQDATLKSLPVILLTSLTDPSDVLRGLEAGADYYITKPYDEQFLLNRIATILSQPSLACSDPSAEPIEIALNSERHTVTAPRRQILNLLISTYANAVEQNRELAKARNELMLSNQELEAFSYSVSHDLRAPLRCIDGFSQALLEDNMDQLDDMGREHLQRICAATRRMGELIDDLLNLARVTRSEMHSQNIDLSSIAQTVATELKTMEPNREVDLVIAEGVMAKGDARLLRVVMDNLLGNAWKFTGKRSGARVEFGVSNQEQPTYYVRDNGAGFDMTYANKLFGVFQRLHGATDFAGTGIGLATVQRAVRRHGGKVWGEGAVDKGATFYFTL